ncbi:MAG: hypothetical protein QNJ72_41485 [Pleurocapsa sp. MO_226.B13]|nr:hypothetical protein [Pleurocapsa sp. MO_226.B13]
MSNYSVVNQCGKILVVKEPSSAIAVVTKIQRGARGADGNDFARDDFIPSLGQTVFNLSRKVTNSNTALLYINGQKQRLGSVYQISGSGTILEWLNISFLLEPSDSLEFYYQYE